MSICPIIDGAVLPTRQNGKTLPCANLAVENAKLRELVRHMRICLEHYEPGDTISCEQCPYDNETWGCDYERLMAELGIEVDA